MSLWFLPVRGTHRPPLHIDAGGNDRVVSDIGKLHFFIPEVPVRIVDNDRDIEIAKGMAIAACAASKHEQTLQPWPIVARDAVRKQSCGLIDFVLGRRSKRISDSHRATSQVVPSLESFNTTPIAASSSRIRSASLKFFLARASVRLASKASTATESNSLD